MQCEALWIARILCHSKKVNLQRKLFTLLLKIACALLEIFARVAHNGLYFHTCSPSWK